MIAPPRQKGDLTVTPSWFRPAILALGLLTSLLLLSPAIAQVKTPADAALPHGKDSPGTVTFSHEKHIAAGNKCTSCHTKVFKMKKPEAGELTMAKMKAGEQCGACHNGKTEVAGKMPFTVDDKANCEKCHKK
jgi:c(7)-type cytochrome triheme protein